jgi:putative transposase
MKRRSTTETALPPINAGAVGKAWDEVSASFERFCLTAGLQALSAMMEQEAEEFCGPRHARGEGRRGYRWGHTQGKIGFHGGKIDVERPRVRELGGQEIALPSWEQAVGEDWLGKWAMNLMLINVSTRKFRRAVRLPEGDIPAPAGAGVSKSATSRHFVALSTERMKNWMATDLSGLDLLVVQIDGIHITEHLVLVAAVGIDGEGIKHPLGLVEGATENAVVVQALIDNLVVRGLDPTRPRLFIIDGSKALCKAIRRTFGRHTPIQRCQIHKARNIMGRLAPALHASVRRVLRLKERARGQELQTATTDDANESRQDRRLHFDGALACFAHTGAYDGAFYRACHRSQLAQANGWFWHGDIRHQQSRQNDAVGKIDNGLLHCIGLENAN